MNHFLHSAWRYTQRHPYVTAGGTVALAVGASKLAPGGVVSKAASIAALFGLGNGAAHGLGLAGVEAVEMLDNPSGLSTPAKVALGAAVVGGGVLAFRGSAGAQSLPVGGGGASGSNSPANTMPIGEGYRMLRAGDAMMLPGAFHLRARPTADPASTDPELPAQVVLITGPSVVGVTRGPREALYPVTVGGATGWAWIPYNASRAPRPTG